MLTPLDVERISGFPVVGYIPELNYRGKTQESLDVGDRSTSSVSEFSWLVKEPRAPVADAFRTLRTNILLSKAGGLPKSLLIISPMPREGKSTTAYDLAVSFAQ